MSGGEPRVRKITPPEHRVMPWKNGLGTTREIAIDPPGATMTDAGFRWRLSIADVGQSGPFSSFPGIDRTIMVIKGRGMVLTVAGAPPRRLDRCFEPFQFSGDAATDCELIDGPIQDFNLMVNRALLRARTEIVTLSDASTLTRNGGIFILHLLDGEAEVQERGWREHVKAGDTLILPDLPTDSGAVNLVPRGKAIMAAITINAAE